MYTWPMIYFAIIIINVHVPDQYSERSCIHVSEVSIVSLFLWYLLLLLLLMQRNNRYLWHMYTWPFTVLVWYMYINNNNNNKRYHRNRETINTSDTCIHDRSLYLLLLLLLLMYMYQSSTVNGHVYMCQRYGLFLCFYDIFYCYYYCNRETIVTSDTCIHDHSLYWSGTCTLIIIIIIIKDIIETEKQSIPLTHVYKWTVMYTCVRGIDCFSVSISFIIIIIINVHVPDLYSERSCIHVSEVLIVSLFLWYLLLLLLLMYMYQTIETEKQSIPLTHVYMTVHCTGLVHVH
jgi:hypothetical protein